MGPRRWGNGWRAGPASYGGSYGGAYQQYYPKKRSYSICGECGAWSHDDLQRTICFGCKAPLIPAHTRRAPWYKGAQPAEVEGLSNEVRQAITKLQGVPDAATVAAVVAALQEKVGPAPTSSVPDTRRKFAEAVTAFNRVDEKKAKLLKNIDRVRGELANFEAQLPGIESDHLEAQSLVKSIAAEQLGGGDDEYADCGGADEPAPQAAAPVTVQEAILTATNIVNAAEAKLTAAFAKKAKTGKQVSAAESSKAKEAAANATELIKSQMAAFKEAAQTMANMAATIQASVPVEEADCSTSTCAASDGDIVMLAK